MGRNAQGLPPHSNANGRVHRKWQWLANVEESSVARFEVVKPAHAGEIMVSEEKREKNIFLFLF